MANEDKFLNKGGVAKLGSSSNYDQYRHALDSYNAFLNQMATEIGEVTSRDQFIDPYSLVDPSNYKKTRAGQAQYNSDLQQAQNYLAQQQAAYQEWYESPEQQALRQRQAGINPDLAGLSENEAAQTEQNPNSPIAGMPTTGQVALDAVNGIVSSIGAMTSLGSAITGFMKVPQELDLLGKQIDGQQAQNDVLNIQAITQFEQVAHKAIKDKIAVAHRAHVDSGNTDAFDVAGFFANADNFSDIIPSYAPSDNPMYQNALARVLKGSESILADAYKDNADALTAHTSFARNLADPWVDSSTLLMSAFFEPIQDALFQLEQAKIRLDQLRSDTESQIVEGLDPDALADDFMNSRHAQAKQEMMQAIIDECKAAQYQNLYDIVKKGSLNFSANAALCMILGQTPENWNQFMTGIANNWLNSGDGTGNKYGPFDSSPNSWQKRPTGPNTGVPDSALPFLPPGAVVIK